MRGWSINLFRIRGIQLSLHFSFLLLLAYVCDEGFKEGGTSGMYWSAGTFLAFFVCVVLHELGHSLTAMKFGVNVRRILLMPIGGVAEFDRIPRKPSQELLITVAGPSVNFTIAGLLWCIIKLSGGWERFEVGPWGDFVITLLTWNIWVGLFNLIPAFPMDGGRIVRALLALKLPYLRATYWAVNIAKVVTIVGVLYAIYRENYFMAVIFVYIFMAGQAEYRAVKRRETDEALWRESLIRHISVPPATEPPVL